MVSIFNDVYQGKFMILRSFYFEFSIGKSFDHCNGK
jgi:hypothetical protein